MSINNREDANKYYQIINELVDEYIDKWKIRPKNLKKYLKPGSKRFNKFLLRHNLSEVKGAEVILKDIIEDRYHMESDGVMTFESFNLFESDEFKIPSMKECLYKGIEKADIKMEKILADVFDTNLGSIDVIDSDKHTFKIEDWEGEDKKVIIYSKEDLEIIKDNMVENLYDELRKKKVELSNKVSVDLSDLIKEDDFTGMMSDQLSISEFDNSLIKEIITDLLEFEFMKEESGYFVWIS